VSTRSTADLVQAAQHHDQQATRQLVDRYTGLVRSTVRSFRLRDVDAQDAVQNTWLRMIEHLGTLRDPDRLPGWLATTARRECLKIIRDGRREVAHDPEVFERPDERSCSPEPVTIDGVMNAMLWHRVSELPGPAKHMVVTLTGVDAPAYGDFARVSGIPVGSIGPKRMRYLRQLRRRLEDSGLGVAAWR
jgi:RNA polymerase sigma factor (sigma-70 family)